MKFERMFTIVQDPIQQVKPNERQFDGWCVCAICFFIPYLYASEFDNLDRS